MEEELSWTTVETSEIGVTQKAYISEGTLYRVQGAEGGWALVFVPRDQGYSPRRSGGG